MIIDETFINKLPSPIDIDLDQGQRDLIFKDMSQIDGLMEYLRDTMSMDIKRYFSAPIEQQQIIMGAYHRTKYFYDLCVKNSSVT